MQLTFDPLCNSHAAGLCFDDSADQGFSFSGSFTNWLQYRCSSIFNACVYFYLE